MSAFPPSAPSSGQLARATLAAIAIAGILLVTVVLPAEFGRDPTGVGQATGLFRARRIGCGPISAGGERRPGDERSTVQEPGTIPVRRDDAQLEVG